MYDGEEPIKLILMTFKYDIEFHPKALQEWKKLAKHRKHQTYLSPTQFC